jgi:hypothetical protein
MLAMVTELGLGGLMVRGGRLRDGFGDPVAAGSVHAVRGSSCLLVRNCGASALGCGWAERGRGQNRLRHRLTHPHLDQLPRQGCVTRH